MTATLFPEDRGRQPARVAVAVLLVALWAASPSLAQTSSANDPIPSNLRTVVPASASSPAQLSFSADVPAVPARTDSAGNTGVAQASCSSCGVNSLLQPAPLNGFPPPSISSAGGAISPYAAPPSLTTGCNCGSGGCYPGRKPCYPCEADTTVGRFLCELYECICCPDPCYDPRWLPIADAAFFVESARPITQTRLRWDAGVNVILPDRAEYFWARADGKGKGPKAPAPFFVEPRLKYNDLSLYTEAATGKIGVIVEMPYRSLDPDLVPHAAGFGDMNLATKTLLFDCELLQVAMLFRTYLPVGSSGKGLGVGHVSLEPSLVVGIRVCPDTFFQGQLSEWIPLGGDPDYAGAILHYHFSLNQVLYRILPDVPLIGTVEFNGWSFQDGAFTDPVAGPLQHAGNESYFSLGSGLRLVVCDRIDFGFGFALSLTEDHFAGQLYRTEFRFRY